MKTRSKLSPEEIERMVAANFGDSEDETGTDDSAENIDDSEVDDEDLEGEGDEGATEPTDDSEVDEDDLEDDTPVAEGNTDGESEDDDEDADEDEIAAALEWAQGLTESDTACPSGEEDEDDEDEEADAAFLEAIASTSEDFVQALIATGAVVCVEPYMLDEERVLASEFAEFDDEEDDVDDDDLEGEGDEGATDDSSEVTEDPESDEISENDLEDEEDETPARRPAPVAEDDDEDDDDVGTGDFDTGDTNDDDGNGYADDTLVAEDEDEADSSVRALDDEEDDEEEDAVEFQPVASLEEIATATADEVEMHFYQDAGNNCHWNVIIAGAPAACITSESMNRDALPFFMTDDFGRNAVKAMASEGVEKVLRGMNARYYATAYRHSELADEVKASVETEANAQLTSKLAEMHSSFLENAALASAGIDKNLWPKVGNPLKEAFYDAMVSAGIHESAVVPMIESVFNAASQSYFKAITAKTVELMNMPQEARDVLRETVANAGTMAVEVESIDDDAPVTASAGSFAEALASGNVSGFRTQASAPVGRGLSAKIAARFGH